MDEHTARDIVSQLNAPQATLRDKRPDADAVAKAAAAIRMKVPLADHSKTAFFDGDRITLVYSVEAGRRPDLRKLRRERMSETPLAFFRGSAMLMAADLRGTPDTGHRFTVCGDAHCENFGLYGSPELAHVFDLSDFDEATTAPWEWDVKRLAASMVLADRARSHGPHAERHAARSAVAAYRAQLHESVKRESLLGRRLRTLRVKDIIKALPADEETRHAAEKVIEDAKKEANYDDLIDQHDVEPRFLKKKATSLEDDGGDVNAAQLLAALSGGYLDSLGSRRGLLRGFRAVDEAFKTVGVGSVGLRDFLVALDGRDAKDVVVLQVKQAQVSQLRERGPDATPPAPDGHQGQRIVRAQLSMQAASDPLLGFTTIGDGAAAHDYYVRQYRNMKGTIEPANLDTSRLAAYGALCGSALARAHTRTGSPSFIGAYVGDETDFDKAVCDFAVTYANRVTDDHAAFKRRSAEVAEE